jgi:hypothetical protein
VARQDPRRQRGTGDFRRFGIAATAASGVNISGLETGGTLPGVLWTDYPMPTTYEIAYYASRGMTIARIPFRGSACSRLWAGHSTPELTPAT